MNMGPKRRRKSDETSPTPGNAKKTKEGSIGSPDAHSVTSLVSPTLPTNKTLPVKKKVAKKSTTAQEILDSPTPSKTPQLPITPKTKGSPAPSVVRTWTVYSAKHAQEYLRSTQTYDGYCVSCRYFYRWLAFVARGLSIGELKQFFNACLPPFLQDGEAFERSMALKDFEDGYTWIESQLLDQLRAYATTWLESPGGSHYHELYKTHR